MSDRETKLAQSYEHYYWNSVEFLNRLKSTKVTRLVAEEAIGITHRFYRESLREFLVDNARNPAYFLDPIIWANMARQ